MSAEEGTRTVTDDKIQKVGREAGSDHDFGGAPISLVVQGNLRWGDQGSELFDRHLNLTSAAERLRSAAGQRGLGTAGMMSSLTS
jgi:hypothetical protein